MFSQRPSAQCAPFLNPLCVALDVDHREQALRLAEELAPLAGGFKLGPRLIQKYGQSLVQEIAEKAPVFVDCKFFDIPSTMVAAVRAVFDTGASVCTVHAMSGPVALRALAELEAELCRLRPFRILAVTILTSWDEHSFASVFKSQSIPTHVLQLAQLVKASGLTGVVCSPEEIELLAPEELFLVTPGIRLPEDAAGDQMRIMTPGKAIKAGSSCLVVGRPIIDAPLPYEAAKKFIASFV